MAKGDVFIRIRRKDLIEARRIVMAGPCRDMAAALAAKDEPQSERQFDLTVYVLGLRELTKITRAKEEAATAATEIVQHDDGKREIVVSAEKLRDSMRKAGYHAVADLIERDVSIPVKDGGDATA